MPMDKNLMNITPEMMKQYIDNNELFDKIPAMVFSKEAKTGKYISCNQAFAEYVHKQSPQEVIGLTDYDLHSEASAAYFLANDTFAMTMDGPHVFVDEVLDNAENPRFFQTTKIKYLNNEGVMCILGVCVDVTTITRAKTAEIKEQELGRRLSLQVQLKEEEKNRDELEKMITALSAEYRAVYHVDDRRGTLFSVSGTLYLVRDAFCRKRIP